MPGRTHSREFKLTVVGQVASGEKRLAQLCREHNLDESVLLRWRKESDARGEAAFALRENAEPGGLEQRVAELERFCGQLALENQIPKKGTAAHGIAERHAMIAAARGAQPEVSLRHQCALFGVNRAWYYRHQREDLAAREAATRLRDAIKRLVLAFPGYGYRRVTKALRRDGWAVNHQRVLRVMRQESLPCQLKRRFVATIDSRQSGRAHPNLLRDAVIDPLNQAWVAEEMHLNEYRTFEEARANLAQCIDAVYNTKRLHSSLGYQPPAEFETDHPKGGEG